VSTLFLKPIDKHNWEEAIQLSVKEEQKSFMASNLYSIAEVQFLENFKVRGIYLGESMIGFTMFGVDPDDQNFWIYRFMIDEKYQGKGLSVPAIKLVIEEIKHIKHINSDKLPVIMIGYNQQNLAAKYAYQKAGFMETEIAPWGEQLALFTL
jgi:diamine N-acetyltransferase